MALMDQAASTEMAELLPNGLPAEDIGAAGATAEAESRRTAVDKPNIEQVKYNSLAECIRGLNLRAQDEVLNRVMSAQDELKASTLTIESYLKGDVRLTERQLVKTVSF